MDKLCQCRKKTLQRFMFDTVKWINSTRQEQLESVTKVLANQLERELELPCVCQDKQLWHCSCINQTPIIDEYGDWVGVTHDHRCQEKKEEGELMGSITINKELTKDDNLIITNTFQYDDNGKEIGKSIGYEIKKEEPKPECDHIVGLRNIYHITNGIQPGFIEVHDSDIAGKYMMNYLFKYCPECGEKLNLKKDL